MAELLSVARSLRFRITALATVVIAAILTIAAVGLVVSQQRTLLAMLDADLRTRAAAIELSLAGGLLPAAVADTNNDERIVQMVNILNDVVASSPNLEGEPPVADWTVGTRTVDDIPVDDGRFRVVTIEIDQPSGPLTVHVGSSYEDVTEPVAVLAGSMALTVPALLVVLATLIWWLVGRTLRPVEEVRTTVAAIDVADLGERVPVPRADDEIGRLATTMNAMLDRIESATVRQRQFVADASHELRSPLTRIRTTLEVDQLHPETADLSATHDSVLREALSMQDLVDDLLHLASSDVGARMLTAAEIDLDDIVLREANRQRERTDIVIDTAGVAAVPLEGDRGQLTRVVRNLADNAVRHAAGVVAFGLQSEGTSVVMSVTDDGPGIRLDDRERVFERFTRLDEARSAASGGAGLGLAIVKDIVERHEGTVTIEDAEPGTRVVVTLPARAQT